MSNTKEPTILTQGESYTWTRSFGSDYPASEWDVQYRFRGNGQGFNVDAVADDGRYEVTITSAMTGAATSGVYQWQAWATNIADPTIVYEIASSEILIKLGFAEDPTTSVDLRTRAQITLDSINDALDAFISSDVTEYEITTPAGSQRVKRSDRKWLESQQKRLEIRVSMERTRERVRNGGALMRTIGVVTRES